MEKMDCPFCLQKGLSIKFDKKSKPYFKCELCSHRVFVNSCRALSSILAWSKTISTLNADELDVFRKKGSVTLNNVKSASSKIAEYVEREMINV